MSGTIVLKFYVNVELIFGVLDENNILFKFH